jgi:hypothetical protein
MIFRKASACRAPSSSNALQWTRRYSQQARTATSSAIFFETSDVSEILAHTIFARFAASGYTSPAPRAQQSAWGAATLANAMWGLILFPVMVGFISLLAGSLRHRLQARRRVAKGES